MPLRFLIDAQLPSDLARRLVELGHDARNVRDIGLKEADDLAIWRHARAKGFALVTKDEDFVTLSNLSADGPPVLWIRLGNTTNARLWEQLGPLLPDIMRRLEQGARLIEVGR